MGPGPTGGAVPGPAAHRPGPGSAAHRPLASWRLAAPLRTYQEEAARAVDPADGARLHLVAPPGSGKTLLGLALAARNGRRAVVLTPTTVIQEQWAAQARQAFRVAGGSAPAASTTGEAPADLTVLTYQSLAVVDGSADWDRAARGRWLAELTGPRTAAQARDWLAGLEATNPRAYRSGLSRRAAAARRHLADLDEEALATILHPSSRRRLDALAAGGVGTVVVDECHHLRAHWAVVVHYLLRRLRGGGVDPTLIGLTATLPCREDPAWSRYHDLLGEVDHEVPVPAVIQEGHLAPYRSLLHLTLPAEEETRFLATAGAELRTRLRLHLLSADGVAYLTRVVAPEVPATTGGAPDVPGPRVPSGKRSPGALPGPDGPTAPGPRVPAAGALPAACPSPAGEGSRQPEALPGPPAPVGEDLVARLAAGIRMHPALALAAAALLEQVGDYQQTPLTTALLPLLPPLAPLGLQDELDLLGDYALNVLLPDPSRRAQWQDLRELLRGFGYRLTDSGLRRGRTPVDALVAASRAKDVAAVDILRREHAALGERLRAVVVTDTAQRSATHRALDVLEGAPGDHAAGARRTRGGALRVYETLLSDAVLRTLHPVLLTADHLWLAHGDQGLLELLRTMTGTSLPAQDDGWTLRVRGGTGAALVRAVGDLVAQGRVRLVVGTRGLLGEGWDCPAVNTLIDLTEATTATTAQQLLGRTLRLDPTWPGKVAHNWTVACLPQDGAGVSCTTDLERVERKLEHQWTASAPAGTPVVRTGLWAGLTGTQQAVLGQAARQGSTHFQAVEAFNADTRVGPRDAEATLWLEGPAPTTSRPARRRGECEVVTVTSAPDLLATGAPAPFLRGAALAVLAGLRQNGQVDAAGRIQVVVRRDGPVSLPGPSGAPAQAVPPGQPAQAVPPGRAGRAGAVVPTRWGSHSDLPAPPAPPRGGPGPVPWDGAQVDVWLEGLGGRQAALLADALSELLTAPRRPPRFVVEVAPLAVEPRGWRSWPPLRRLALLLARHRADRRGHRALYLALPTAVGRSQAGAAAFTGTWEQEVGPCRLHLVREEGDLAALVSARGPLGVTGRLTVRRCRLWCPTGPR